MSKNKILRFARKRRGIEESKDQNGEIKKQKTRIISSIQEKTVDEINLVKSVLYFSQKVIVTHRATFI